MIFPGLPQLSASSRKEGRKGKQYYLVLSLISLPDFFASFYHIYVPLRQIAGSQKEGEIVMKQEVRAEVAFVKQSLWFLFD